jgi:uncharacterized phage protein gp47/JayE
VAELTPAGLLTRTQAEILAEIEADQRAEISTELDQSTSSPLGQINRILARALALLEEAVAATYASLDPDGATGDALDRVAAITGTIREPATASRVSVVCTLTAGTYAAGTLRAAPAGRPEDVFTNAAEVVAPGGNTSVVFECLTTGPVAVTANTLAIASPVAGWSAIVSHPAATLGRAVETDGALRQRRNAEVEAPGSSSARGIAADLTREVRGIISVTVVENDSDVAVDSIPSHSIECIVYGPEVPTGDDDDAVAEQILASKAAGIGTYGTTSRTVIDSEGQSKIVRFTRPADVACTAAAALVVDASVYPGDTEVEEYVAARAAEVLVPGLDLSWDMIVGWIRELPGVLRLTTVSVNGGAFGTATITTRQRATLDASDVTITSTPGTP